MMTKEHIPSWMARDIKYKTGAAVALATLVVVGNYSYLFKYSEDNFNKLTIFVFAFLGCLILFYLKLLKVVVCAEYSKSKCDKLKKEILNKNIEIIDLQLLVNHCWVHSGYTDCGSNQMGSEEKRLYETITSMDNDILHKMKEITTKEIASLEK